MTLFGIDFDNRWGTMDPDSPDPHDKRPGDEPEEAPETPLDEPRPSEVRDPPPEPDRKGPFVVRRS